MSPPWSLAAVIVSLKLLLAAAVGEDSRVQPASNTTAPEKVLPIRGEVFAVAGRTAFVIPGQINFAGTVKPWVWYAPTLPGLPGPEERWMFERFIREGIAVAGIDVGESYGSPTGCSLFTEFHAEMTHARGFSPKPVLLGRSRGGLMTLSWAADHPDQVAGFAGIYPVCNLASYPGVDKAAGAYGLTPGQLQQRLTEFNPIDRVAPLARARVPFFAIHGDADQVVPLELNSGLLKERLTALGGSIELVVPHGQGHNMWSGFFQCEELARFVIANAKPAIASDSQTRRVTPASNSSGTNAARELIRDPHFRAGFNLIEPQPGRRVIYGRLPGVSSGEESPWDLDQWSSRFPLKVEAPSSQKPRVESWANAGKVVARGGSGLAEADLSLGVDGVTEYSGRARQPGEPWVHLLVEQSFVNSPSIAELRSARLQLQARLLRSRFHSTPDYSPGLHAAQFQLFLMVQNMNRESKGYGKLLWFGIPLYDDRARFPKEHKQQDTGGTTMYIFTPGGEVFSTTSAHDGDWISVDKELRPLFLEALESAWAQGFLRESRDLVDYRVNGMNLGWEVPGLFDVEMQVKNLSLQTQP